MNSLNKLSRLISDIFVPPTFTLISFILLGLKFEDDPLKNWIVILSGVAYGFLFPIIFFLLMRKKGKIINNDATIKEERTFPYIVGTIFCLAGFITLYLADASSVAVSLWLSYAVNTLLLIIINKFWKISAHAIGVTTFFGLLFFIYGAYSIPFIFLVITIAAARLILGVHTPAQVFWGSIFGFGLTYAQLLLYTTLL